jgi:hypothetical protein
MSSLSVALSYSFLLLSKSLQAYLHLVEHFEVSLFEAQNVFLLRDYSLLQLPLEENKSDMLLHTSTQLQQESRSN